MAVIMKAPKGCGSLSLDGRSYTPTKKGLVKVPDQHVRELIDFGFTVAAPEDSEDAEANAAFLEAQKLQEQVEAGYAEKQALDAEQARSEAAARAISDKIEGVAPAAPAPAPAADEEPAAHAADAAQDPAEAAPAAEAGKE